MNTMELIRRRRSVRSYGEALTAEETARLLAFAAAAENPYGLPCPADTFYIATYLLNP